MASGDVMYSFQVYYYHETEKAILVAFEDNAEDDDKIWLPKSYCKYDDEGDIFPGTKFEVNIPEWLIEKKPPLEDALREGLGTRVGRDSSRSRGGAGKVREERRASLDPPLLTEVEFKLLLKVVHPDRQAAATTDERNEAVRILLGIKKAVTRKEVDPDSPPW